MAIDGYHIVTFDCNVNDRVKIRLKPEGIKILQDIYRRIPTLQDWEPTIDAEGYYGMSIWDFMNTFGPYTRIGFPVPFETDIQIQKYEKDKA